MSIKSYLPSKKIYLSQITGWDFFRALVRLFNLLGLTVDPTEQPLAVLDFQKKILAPADPQDFIFSRQNKYSGHQKLYLTINGMQ